MKKLIAIIAFFFLTAIPAAAITVNLTFEWDPNQEADLAGYRLYMSSTSGQYVSHIQQVGKVTTTVEQVDIDPGEILYFVLTAFDLDNNESGYSNEVSFFLDDTSPGVAPSAPVFRLKSWAPAGSK
jgi:hypothetical protein